MNWQRSSYCSEGNSCVHIAAFTALLTTLKKESPRG